MEPLIIFCKSYSGDLDRFKVLLKSIATFNSENIPLYVSVPKEDKQLFLDETDLPKSSLIVDEEVISKTLESTWTTQQVVKASVYNLGICDNYLMIDSDSYFIKQFKYNDFLYTPEIPYTVVHEQKDLWQYVAKKCYKDSTFKHFHQYDHDGFKKMRGAIQVLMNRPGRALDFGPGPVIWNCAVWKDLESYLKILGLTLEKAICSIPSEFTWYGEHLLTSKQAIPIIPIEPPFKFYHHKEQYIDAIADGVTTEILKENYLGIVMQSNWGAPLQYDHNN